MVVVVVVVIVVVCLVLLVLLVLAVLAIPVLLVLLVLLVLVLVILVILVLLVLLVLLVVLVLVLVLFLLVLVVLVVLLFLFLVLLVLVLVLVVLLAPLVSLVLLVRFFALFLFLVPLVLGLVFLVLVLSPPRCFFMDCVGNFLIIRSGVVLLSWGVPQLGWQTVCLPKETTYRLKAIFLELDHLPTDLITGKLWGNNAVPPSIRFPLDASLSGAWSMCGLTMCGLTLCVCVLFGGGGAVLRSRSGCRLAASPTRSRQSSSRFRRPAAASSSVKGPENLNAIHHAIKFVRFFENSC